jgi:hypothetical protein
MDAGMAWWTPLAGASLVARGKLHRWSGSPEVGGDGCYAAQDRSKTAVQNLFSVWV